MMTSVYYRLFLTALLCGPATASLAQQEPVVVLESKVQGNQEQPTVLYLLPWQPPTGAEGLIQPLDSLINESQAPLEREEFQRELEYRGRLSTAIDKK